MHISRRILLQTAVGAALGCEKRVPPDDTPRPPEVARGGNADCLGSEPTAHRGDDWSRAFDHVINEVLVYRRKQLETVICQMLARPADAREAALFLQHGDAGWQLVARRAIVSLSEGVGMRLERGMESAQIAAALRGSIEESVRPVPEALASVLQKTWTEMLLRTRPRLMPELDLHRNVYSFAHHHLAGVTLPAEQQTLVGRFTGVGNGLLEATTLAGEKYDTLLASVGRRAVALLKDLLEMPDRGPIDSSWALERLYGAQR